MKIKAVNLLVAISLVGLVIFFGSLYTTYSSSKLYHKNVGTLPSVQFIPADDLLEKNQRVSDLYSIVLALEQYKLDHRSYPQSGDDGKGWSVYVGADGKINERWIERLYPEYMTYIPTDFRKSTHPAEQYAYMSDGANYKLIAGYPEDCASIKNEYPALVLPIGDCVAYGFWTSELAIYW